MSMSDPNRSQTEEESSGAPVNSGNLCDSTASQFVYQALPSSSSIRLLDIIESTSQRIRCQMHIVDLNDNPDFAALSYTWGNPVTVYEEPMPDIEQLNYPEDIQKYPFAYTTPPLGPNGEEIAGIDDTKRDYLSLYPNLPHEKVNWNGGAPRLIEIDGCDVRVEENLFLYLESVGRRRERFSQKHGDNFDVYYHNVRLAHWIDALCVNQADLSERAQQIPLMGRIFQSAKVVFAWLGPSDQLSSIAWEAVEHVLDFESERAKALDDWTGASSTQPPRPMDVSLGSVPNMTTVHWFALVALFHRLWFRRAWIAQEIIFAKNVVMVCSNDIASINLLLTVFGFIQHHGLEHDLCTLGRGLLTGQPLSEPARCLIKAASFSSIIRQDPEPPATASSHMTIDPMDTFSFMLGYHRVRGRLGLSEAGMPLMRHRVRPPEDERRLKSWNVEIPTQIDLSDHVMEEVEPGRFRFHRRPLRLITVLSIFRALDATDPRDKIFAFLNLATDNLSLLPDYTIDVQEVFRRAAETIMTATGTLSVLSQVQDPQDTKIQGLPSWVPDFSVRIQRAPFDEGDEGCQFRASSWSNPVKMVFNADGTLTVDGFRVGAVCSVINLDQDPVMEVLKLALKVPPEYPGHPRGWWHLTNGEGGGRRALRARVMNRVEALWRTLIADNLTETEEESEEVGSRARFGGGFASWILADILEARSFFVQEVQDSNPISWLEQLTGASFLTRMFLWSAIYDGHQVPNFSFSNMSIEDMLSDLENKEAEERDQYQLDQYLGISSPRVGVEHLPTAHQIKAPFYKPRRDEMQDREEKANYHRSNALSRLDPAEIRRLHIFEAHMNRVTEGRLLFYTDRGMFGLGPKSTNLEAQCTDEIWILNGAKVPFILRWDAGMRYKIVGEAYVHGVMHGEETGVMKEIHII